MQQLSDLRGLPHVYMFVCVLWVDTNVSSVITAADITQLSQCHTHCSRLKSRSHAVAEKEKELTFFFFVKTGLWEKGVWCISKKRKRQVLSSETLSWVLPLFHNNRANCFQLLIYGFRFLLLQQYRYNLDTTCCILKTKLLSRFYF